MLLLSDISRERLLREKQEELERHAFWNDLAAGEPAAFVGAVKLKACPSVMRQRIGIDFRLLFRLLRSIQAAEPFTRGNVRRINAIALIVGLGGMLVQLTQGFADNAIHTSGRLPDSSAAAPVFELSFTPIPLVAMLVIALVGEVLRRGIELRDDVAGLV